MNDRQIRQEIIAPVRSVVVKIGTSLLPVNRQGVRLDTIKKLIASIAGLAPRYRFTLVTSGAVGFGMQAFGMARKPAALPVRQSIAAVGQIHLMGLYHRLFHRRGIPVAQLLLTHDSVSDRRQYINAMSTFAALHRLGVIPVVNENDTVAVEELGIGDNDQLAAYVTHLDDADLLIILTDVEGLHAARPEPGKSTPLIPTVRKIDQHVLACAGCAGGIATTGGMVTKLRAARLVTGAGVPLIVANGLRPNVIPELLRGELTGTLFVPQRARLRARERFIAYGSRRAGSLRVDAGAERALLTGNKSLLFAGITGWEGDFGAGEVVGVSGPAGHEFARGIAAYSAADLTAARTHGRPRALKEVIHRDHLVILLMVLK